MPCSPGNGTLHHPQLLFLAQNPLFSSLSPHIVELIEFASRKFHRSRTRNLKASVIIGTAPANHPWSQGCSWQKSFHTVAFFKSKTASCLERKEIFLRGSEKTCFLNHWLDALFGGGGCPALFWALVKKWSTIRMGLVMGQVLPSHFHSVFLSLSFYPSGFSSLLFIFAMARARRCHPTERYPERRGSYLHGAEGCWGCLFS